MDINLLLILALALMLFHNYRLQIRLNHIENYALNTSATEAIHQFVFIADLLIQEGVAELPDSIDNTPENRIKEIYKVIEELSPVAYKRYKLLNL